MPWVLYKEETHDTGGPDVDPVETEILAVLSSPEIAMAALPNQTPDAKSIWRRREADCFKWQPVDEHLWEYRALHYTDGYVLREFVLNDLGKVER